MARGQAARIILDKLFRSIALIQELGDGPTKWLLRWEPKLNQWRFIVGERLNKESFRETIQREVAWQLDLDAKTDFLVSNMAQLSMEYVDSHPENELEQHVAVSFYQVHIYRRPVLEKLNAEHMNRWVSATEICEGQTADQHCIDPTVVQWINKWQIVQPWQ